MSSAQYKIMKKSGASSSRGSSGKEKTTPAVSKAYKARSELIAALKAVQPALAAEIEQSDAIDHDKLNQTEEQLTRELVYLNRDCDRMLVKYDGVPQPPSRLSGDIILSNAPDASLSPDHSNTAVVSYNYIGEKLAKALLRRQAITAELQQIREQRDAPLFVRMNAASELLKSGLDQYAAEVLLDLISSGFYGLEQLISGDSDTVEFCLRRIATIHGTAWLDRLIISRPPAVANYTRLRELIKDSIL